MRVAIITDSGSATYQLPDHWQVKLFELPFFHLQNEEEYFPLRRIFKKNSSVIQQSKGWIEGSMGWERVPGVLAEVLGFRAWFCHFLAAQGCRVGCA